MNCINRDAFALPAQYTYGNSARNPFYGPGLVNFDTALAKTFPIHDRPLAFQFRADGATLESYFDPLAYYIEQFMITGKEPYPVERVLLANGILCAGLDSLRQGEKRLQTPQLDIHYQPGQSTLRRT